MGSQVVGCGEEPRTGGGDPQTLGEAELFAESGERRWSPELVRGETTVDGTELDYATQLVAGADNDFYVLIESSTPYLIDVFQAGDVVRAAPVPFTSLRHNTAVGIGQDGTLAAAGLEVPTPILWVRQFYWTGVGEIGTRFPVGAIWLDDDGSATVGSREDARIDRVAPDGGSRGLLGPTGSDAQAILEEPLGAIVSLVGLRDGRITFVADTADGFQLNLLDGSNVRHIEARQDGQRFNPVVNSGARPTDPSMRPDRLAMTPLALAPDGRVLTTGLERRGDPQISLVDVDTGEVETLAVLDGVEPTIEEPVSAAIVGDDLIFLAEAKLWKLDDVIER